MPSIRNIIITQPLKIQTLSSIVSTLNFATHILPQSQYHQGNPSHRQSIMNMCESSHSKRQSKSKSCSQSCLSSTSTSVSTPSPSLSSSSSTPTSFTMITDIEEIHTQAIQAKAKTYIDPSTGFTVFTEYAHLKRGRCCGNMCRHCPYGWENVTYEENGELVRRQAKVKSGDRERVKILLDRIENESECKGDNEITDFMTNNVDDGESTKTQLTIINVEKSQHVPTNTNTASSRQFINTTEANLTDKVICRGKGGRKGGTFTSKNVPYTRSGDEGTSMLLTGERRSKDDASFEAMGTVDELCSVVGVAHAELLHVVATKTPSSENSIDYGELDDWLLEIMSRLFDVGSHVAKPKRKRVREENTSNCDFQDDSEIENSFTPDGIGGGFDEVHIDILEEWIDILTERLPELTSFVLPTGGKASAQLHFARCVCRRAERRVLPLVREGVCDPNTARYLNRLSDFLFTAARWCNFCEGKEEVQYRRYFRGATQRGMVKVTLHRDERNNPT